MGLLGFLKSPKANSSNSVDKFEMDFNGQKVLVQKKPYQRKLKLTVKPNGQIQVTTSKNFSVKNLQSYLKENQQWIKKSLSHFVDVKNKYPKRMYIQGESFLFFGEIHFLNYVCVKKQKNISVKKRGSFLICSIPKSKWDNSYLITPQLHMKAAIQKFYENHGRNFLKASVQKWSEEMGLIPTTVFFRSQKTRWGSCTTEGAISLNWKLALAPKETIDYVVIHELAHLKHHDHSAKFWELVAKHSPNYKAHRKWLHDHQYEFDFLAKKSDLYLEEEGLD